MEQAGLADARGILILPSDELVSLQTALVVRQLHATIRVVVRMFNQKLITRWAPRWPTCRRSAFRPWPRPLLALVARTGEALSTFQMEDGDTCQIAEFTVAANSPLLNRSLGDEARRYQAAVVAHMPAGGKPRFVHEVDDQALLATGDRVVVCAPRPAWLRS